MPVARKSMAGSPINEAAARMLVSNVLVAVIDEVMADHDTASGIWPIHLQTETALESDLVTVNGIDQKFRGISDYSLWYGDGNSNEKAINLIVIEAKRKDFCSTGDDKH
ncbi:hypothetical protein N7454_005582 [Penicillium verhagenii]|nr:hypothetical protein N7454_005582 [Penicillium verhagenii]